MQRRRGTALAVALTIGLFIAGTPASASTWTVTLHAGSSAEVKALASPSTPTGVTATCTASTAKTVTVVWGAIIHATTYSIYDSTTSSTGTYSVLASGVTGTSWTSGTLAVGNYTWFEVAALIGTNWVSARMDRDGRTDDQLQQPQVRVSAGFDRVG